MTFGRGRHIDKLPIMFDNRPQTKQLFKNVIKRKEDKSSRSTLKFWMGTAGAFLRFNKFLLVLKVWGRKFIARKKVFTLPSVEEDRRQFSVFASIHAFFLAVM
jgi:hypothetical protein